MKNLRYYLKMAQKEKWAVGQFNFSTLDQMRGILEAAKNLKSPVILGTSEGESGYLGLKEIIALLNLERGKIPAFLNLDHGKDIKIIKKAIDAGYSAVHYDGSKLPIKENIKNTLKAVNYAKKRDVLTEGEIGHVEGDSSVHKKELILNKEEFTSPEQAEEFTLKTKVDSLAIAIGSAHGIYSGLPCLDFDRLAKISERVKVFLVLHGGSGIDENQIKRAIKLGIVKININTEIRLSWAREIKRQIDGNEPKPYKILNKTQEAVQKKVEEKIKLFGSINKA